MTSYQKYAHISQLSPIYIIILFSTYEMSNVLTNDVLIVVFVNLFIVQISPSGLNQSFYKLLIMVCYTLGDIEFRWGHQFSPSCVKLLKHELFGLMIVLNVANTADIIYMIYKGFDYKLSPLCLWGKFRLPPIWMSPSVIKIQNYLVWEIKLKANEIVTHQLLFSFIILNLLILLVSPSVQSF